MKVWSVLFGALMCVGAEAGGVEVSIAIGNVVMDQTKDDLCIEHIDIESTANDRIINVKAQEETTQNSLKDLNFEELSRRAKAGDFNAQYYLACCYDIGHDTEQNRSMAVNWYRKAAQQGHTRSQFLMGKMAINNQTDAAHWYMKAAQSGLAEAQCRIAYHYKFGYGLEQNYQEAFGWYYKALRHDSGEAMVNIGNMYYYGRGTKQNYLLAFQCFQRCLGQKITFFQPYLCYRIAYMYQNGLGIEQDYVRALKFYRAATKSDDFSGVSPYACHQLAVMYEQGMGVKKDEREASKWHQMAYDKGYKESPALTGQQPVSATNAADYFGYSMEELAQKANAGDVNAQFCLGENYFFEGPERNIEAALEWLVKAAEQGHAEAQFRLGTIYSFGEGVEQNAPLALQWYRKSAEQGFEGALLNLANMYYYGEGTPVDYAEAMKWALKAAESNDNVSYILIGKMYFNGEGVIKNRGEAEKWFLKAAESGNGWPLFDLGLQLIDGRGTAKNSQEGYRWILKAAELGEPRAQYFIGNCYLEGRLAAKDAKQAHEWFHRSIDSGSTVPGTYYKTGIMCRDGIVAAKNLKEAYKWLVLAAKPYNISQFTPNYNALISKNQQQQAIETIMIQTASGLNIPSLSRETAELKKQLTASELREAQVMIDEFLSLQDRRVKQRIDQINAEYRAKQSSL